MNVFHYHPETGVYLGVSVADESPLEPGEFLIPANATHTQPPEPQDGFDIRFSNGAWGYSPITEPEIEPTPDPVVTDDMVNIYRDARIAGGTTVQVTGYGAIPLQGREKDQTNLLGLVQAASLRMAGGDITTLTKFRDAFNVDHMLTPPQIIDMWSKGSAWISSVYDASWALKDQTPIPLDYTDDAYWP